MTDVSSPDPSDYTFWTQALAGIKQEVHESEPHQGRWYMRQEGGGRVPVATWVDPERGMVALVGYQGDTKLRDALGIWTYICQHPVNEEAYNKAFDSGVWPDDPPAPIAATSDGQARSNQPPEDDESLEGITAILAGEEEQTAIFLDKEVKTQEQADMAGTWAKRLTTLRGKVESLHKTAKAPHLAAGRQVDGEWFPLRDRASDLATRLKKHVQPFLVAEQRKAQEAERKAAEEAEELRKQAAEKMEKADDETSAEAAQELAEKADQVEQAAKDSTKKKGQAGRTGSKVALTTVTVAIVVDYDKAYAALKDHPDMKAKVQELANRAAKAKMPVDGVEFKEEKQVR